MAKKFKTKMSRARFTVSPYTAWQMKDLAEVVKLSIRGRIATGLDVNDRPAPPLKIDFAKKGKSYAARKVQKGKKAIRDWVFTGRTLRSMHVLRANQNKAIIGFAANNTAKLLPAGVIAYYNNRRHLQFGMSPKDWKLLLAAVRKVPIVKVKTQEFPIQPVGGWDKYFSMRRK